MSKHQVSEANARAYTILRGKSYKSLVAPPKRARPEPTSRMKTPEPEKWVTREWIDCPQDKAEVAAILRRGK